jgi:hypothetical protein
MDKRAAQEFWEIRAESKGLVVQRRHLVRGGRIAERLGSRERGSEGVGVCEGDNGVDMKDRLLLGDGPGVERTRYHRLGHLPEME